MDLSSIYHTTEQFSNNTLTNLFVNTENPVGNMFNNILFRFPDWIFILIATVISAIVAVKLDRKFRDKNRIHNDKLVREALSESLSATLIVFFYGFLIFIGLGLLYFGVKWGMKYSSTFTILVLIILAIIYLVRKKIKKNKKAAPLRRYRNKSRMDKQLKRKNKSLQ